MAKNNSSPPVTLTVAEIMIPAKDVFAIKPPMTLEDVAELFVIHGISGAPVLDTQGRLLSLIGEGVLLRAAARYGLSTLVQDLLSELPAEADLITLKRDAMFAEAYRLFITHNIHRIPVMDNNGLLLGLVSRSMILKMFVEAHYGKKISKR